jgi:glycoside hydrolase-like protein
VTFVIDASFWHAQMTPAAMKRIGASGAILYAGCDYTAKNATKSEIDALLGAGINVGLVVENYADDALKGRAEGERQGRNIVAAAKAVGYDVSNCVLFAGADFNTQPSQEAAVDAFMAGFNSVVPVAGFYGNSYAIDNVYKSKHAEVFWQSDSTSFSYGPSPHAHLLQRYNDPRAKGLALDVNDIQHTPLRLMGEEDVALTAEEHDMLVWIKQKVDDGLTVAQNQELYNKIVSLSTAVPLVKSINTALTDQSAGVVVGLAKILNAVQNGTVGGGTVDAKAVTDAVVAAVASLKWTATQ